MKTKFCPKCKTHKPLDAFYIAHNRKDGRAAYCKLCGRIYGRAWTKAHPENRRQISYRVSRKLKVEVLTHYGNGKLACVICGENRLPCLSIDHIEGGGIKHTNKLGKHGRAFYRWLRQQGYPKGYQTLCMNCQFIKREENKEYGRGQRV